MVFSPVFENDKKSIQLLMEHLKTLFLKSHLYFILSNQKLNNTIYDQEVICYDGKDHIIEEMDGLHFKIGPKSFFQTNSEQAKILYKKQKNLDITNKDIVYDFTLEQEL